MQAEYLPANRAGAVASTLWSTQGGVLPVSASIPLHPWVAWSCSSSQQLPVLGPLAEVAGPEDAATIYVGDAARQVFSTYGFHSSAFQFMLSDSSQM